MSWVTEDWRLKVLALALAMVMLGAVAFAQNPSTSKVLHPIVNYTLPPDEVILNGPKTVAAIVYGPSDLVGTMTDVSITATVDASKAPPGPAVTLPIVISTLSSLVLVQNPRVPVALNIDHRAIEELPVQVNVAHVAPGWNVTKAQAVCGASITVPCVVHFDGPVSWEKAANLTAFVNYINVVQANSYSSSSWPVQLSNSNGVLDPLTCNTTPPCGLDVSNVTVNIEAHPGSSSSTIPLVDAPPSHGPPPGYRITGITISPSTVVIQGDPTVIGKIPSITLPARDLSNATSTVSLKVAIPYPDGVQSEQATATITYTIQKNPNVSSSPSP